MYPHNNSVKNYKKFKKIFYVRVDKVQFKHMCLKLLMCIHYRYEIFQEMHSIHECKRQMIIFVELVPQSVTNYSNYQQITIQTLLYDFDCVRKSASCYFVLTSF